ARRGRDARPCARCGAPRAGRVDRRARLRAAGERPRVRAARACRAALRRGARALVDPLSAGAAGGARRPRLPRTGPHAMNTAVAAPASVGQSPYFSFKRPLRFQGERFTPSDAEPFAYRWYDKDRIVLGKRMEEQLRFAVCYWHSFVGTGTDPFGDATFNR